MKSTLIYVDMMVALPIALAAVVMLFWGFSSSYAYLTASAGQSSAFLSMFYRSQAVAYAEYSGRLNYTQESSLASYVQGEYNISIGAFNLSRPDGAECQGLSVCRVLTISNRSYLLVVKGEKS